MCINIHCNWKDVLGDPFSCYLPCIDKDVKRLSIGFIRHSIAAEQILKVFILEENMQNQYMYLAAKSDSKR